MNTVNFELFLHKDARPINYSHELHCNQVALHAYVIAHGYRFQIWFIGGNKPLLVLTNANGETVQAKTLTDVDVDVLDREFTPFLKAAYELVHHDAHPINPVARGAETQPQDAPTSRLTNATDIMTQIGNVRNCQSGDDD